MEAHIESFASRLSVLETRAEHIEKMIEQKSAAAREAVVVALAVADKATALAQVTAERAVSKAETKADKETLRAEVEMCRESLTAQVVAARDALNASLLASEKAIAKADIATAQRFESMNEFRSHLSDQQKTLVLRTETDFKFAAIEKKLDEMGIWHRTVDLKFSEYVSTAAFEPALNRWTEWRRKVDEALTAAASKSGVIYAFVAMGIAAGGLLLAIFNSYVKAPIAN